MIDITEADWQSLLKALPGLRNVFMALRESRLDETIPMRHLEWQTRTELRWRPSIHGTIYGADLRGRFGNWPRHEGGVLWVHDTSRPAAPAEELLCSTAEELLDALARYARHCDDNSTITPIRPAEEYKDNHTKEEPTTSETPTNVRQKWALLS